jgi:signal peptidase I
VLPGVGHIVLGRWARGFTWWFVILAVFLTLPVSHGAGLVATLALVVGATIDVLVIEARPLQRALVMAAGVFSLVGLSAVVRGAVRELYLEPFRIPQASMFPTVWPEDYVFISKLPTSPTRGSVAVFRYPHDPSRLFIKRVIALPGESVRVFGGSVFIDGLRVMSEPTGDCAWHKFDSKKNRIVEHHAECATETLGDSSYSIVRDSTRSQLHYPQHGSDFVVPADHFFVLGDNRDHSWDSREWGPVPMKNLVGKPIFRWLSFGRRGEWLWDRFGEAVN